MARSGWLTAGEVPLHYLAAGPQDGPAVLFLHGSAANAHWWDFVVPHLSDRYRCFALDLRGHGDSDPPRDGHYSLAAHVRDVEYAVTALGLHRPAVVGHSFGGFVAMRHAASRGGEIAALAVVDSRVRLGARSVRFLAALRRFPVARHASAAEAIKRFRLFPAATAASPAVLQQLARHCIVERDGAWTLKGDRDALGGAAVCDLGPDVATLRCPVLIIRGALSTVVDADALSEYRAMAPDIAVAEIPEAHHHVMLDQPERLAVTLRDFLETHHSGC